MTDAWCSAIIIRVGSCRCGGMVDTGDLKSPGSDTVPVRVRSPAPSLYRGVEQLVARRAHNPEVVGSSPASATIRTAVFRMKTAVFLYFYSPFHFPITGYF